MPLKVSGFFTENWPSHEKEPVDKAFVAKQLHIVSRRGKA